MISIYNVIADGKGVIVRGFTPKEQLLIVNKNLNYGKTKIISGLFLTVYNYINQLINITIVDKKTDSFGIKKKTNLIQN